MLRLNLNTIVGFIQKTMYLSCAQMDVYTLDGQNLTLIGMRQGGFTPLIIFGLDFVS